MADVNDIIAYGFGGWSNVNSVPTLGFGMVSTSLTQVALEIRLPLHCNHIRLPFHPHIRVPLHQQHQRLLGADE